MTRDVGLRGTVLLVLMLALATLGLHGCGGNDRERDRERCDVCDPRIDQGCRRECMRFCLAGEPCEARCQMECDECTAELRCAPCTAGCTGAAFRCAPADERFTCGDGEF